MRTRSKFANVPIVLSALILYASTVTAQAAVTPSVCFEMKRETTTRTLTSMASSYDIGYDGH